MKLSDYIVGQLADWGVRHIFLVTGGGAMHLNDSIGKEPCIHYVCNHHEQASAMAAEAYARISGLRQFGDQEADIIAMAENITKYAVMVDDPLSIRYHLERAWHLAQSGRPGPCWIHIPVDVQAASIDPVNLRA